MKLRAIHDFDPKQMRYSERIELEHILKSQRQVKLRRVTEKMDALEQWQMPDQNKGHQQGYQRSEFGNQGNMKDQLKTSNLKEQIITEQGTTACRKILESGDEVTKNSLGQKLHLSEETLVRLKVTEGDDSDAADGKEEDRHSMELEPEQEDEGSTSIDLDETYYHQDKVDPYAEAIPFNKGDKMETIPPANIG